MSDLVLISKLIAKIYEAIGNPAIWDEFLCDLSEALNGKTMTLFLYNSGNPSSSMMASNQLDPVELKRYENYYSKIDMWGLHGRHLLDVGAVVRGNQCCPDNLLERSEFNADFLRRLDVFHQVAGIIGRNDDVFSMIASCRPKRVGPYSVSELKIIEILLPHLRQALALQRRLGSLVTQVDWQLQSINRLPFGLLLLSQKRQVVFSNSVAENYIRQNDGLQLKKHILCASLISETRHLHRLIDEMTQGIPSRGLRAGGAILVTRPSRRRSFHLLVSRYQPSNRWAGGEQPAAVILITDPESRLELPYELLMRLYDLTRAEARIASGLLGGDSLAELADRTGVTYHTARSHLKKIFAKTNVSRQSELIRVLMSSLQMCIPHEG